MYKLREMICNVVPPSRCIIDHLPNVSLFLSPLITASLWLFHCYELSQDKLEHHRLRNKVETVSGVSFCLTEMS